MVTYFCIVERLPWS